MKDRRCRYCQQVFRPAPYHPQQLGLQPACLPEPTPLRLSSAEDRLRSGVPGGLLGESTEVAQGEPGLLEEDIARITPSRWNEIAGNSAGGTKNGGWRILQTTTWLPAKY